MRKSTRFTLSASSLAMLAVLFVAVIMVSNALFRGMRADLTENNLYTISEGTRNILKGIDEPINLYYFFSDRATRDLPFLRTYANRVRELLEELTLYADGKLTLHIIDPLPFSEDEDRATELGLQAVPAGMAGDNVFFGLAGTNSTDGLETIAFFQPDKEAFLEYDLSKLIHNLAQPKKAVIGLLSTLPMGSGFDPMTRQMRQPWFIHTQIDQLFEVRTLETEITAVDEEIDVLMLVHPKALPEQTLYAIDQFVLGGGNTVVFVDPVAEADVSARDPNNPAAAMFADRSSKLPQLLEAWGVDAVTDKVITDARFALEVSTGRGRPPGRHLAILGVNGDGLAGEDVVTSTLDSINFATTGYVQKREDANTELLPLLQSSPYAMPMEVQRVQFSPDPAGLQEGFKPTGERYALAARVQGKVSSAFPDGPPGEDPDASLKEKHRTESTDTINLIVVADTDLLSDRLWVQVQNFFGQRLASTWANNGDFVANALDNLTGSSDLISIRGRATSSRPFDRVETLKVRAEEKFRDTEQQLQQRLQETERKLSELQAQRDDNENPLILSAEQRAELEQFQQQKLAIRKELRQVQRGLDEDIEQLGTTLKIINIILVPLLVSVGAAAIAMLRRKRQRTALGARA